MPITNIKGSARENKAPIKVPESIPNTKPRMVLCFPKIGFPRNFLPKSIGVPPPNITGAPLATYAGKI